MPISAGQIRKLCRGVVRQIGKDLESADRLIGGFTPQVILRLRFAGGAPAILKAAPPPALTAGESIDWTAMLRREIRVYRDLDYLARWRPAMYMSGESGGWVWLLLEDLSDAARVPPWTEAAVDAVACSLADMHRIPIAALDLPDWLRSPAPPEPVFERSGRAERSVGGLPGFARDEGWWSWWEEASPVAIAAVGRLHAAPRRSLNHVDTRADNIFLRDDRALFIDWANARLSYPALDSVYWALGVEVDGFGPAVVAHARYRHYNPDLTDDDVHGALAFFAGYFVDCLQRADSPARVQGLRIRYLGPTLRWFAAARGLPDPPLGELGTASDPNQTAEV